MGPRSDCDIIDVQLHLADRHLHPSIHHGNCERLISIAGCTLISPGESHVYSCDYPCYML